MSGLIKLAPIAPVTVDVGLGYSADPAFARARDRHARLCLPHLLFGRSLGLIARGRP
jgi:hypothetical protein